MLDRSEGFGGIAVSLEAGGAEEDHGVLNLFAAEARQRFLIFGQDAQNAAVGAVEERWVLVGYWRRFQVVSHK